MDDKSNSDASSGNSVLDTYKIILAGDASVGKSHLVSRYVLGRLPATAKATIGIEFCTRTIALPIGGAVKAQIWDTAGQERYRSIAHAHYRRALGAILVYDVTAKQTFVNVSRWLDDILSQAEPDIVVMLVGNKSDLIEKDPNLREVPYELAAKFAYKNRLFFCEASALKDYNVKHIFESLMQEIYNSQAKSSTAQGSEGFELGRGSLKLAASAIFGGRGEVVGDGRKRLAPGDVDPSKNCCAI